MHYIFKILVLGDPKSAYDYIKRALQEEGENRGSYREWYKEFHVLENVCDLEIDVITDTISADFDEIIPSVDGIFYFLDPRNDEEVNLFNMIIPIIDSVKRDIPTIIMFYSREGILPFNVNDLLEDIWINFPNFEAFINLPPKDFHQALECLCIAMVNGETPLNIENSWLRYPIFIKLANLYYNHNNYYNAAKALTKAAVISEIYNREEHYILYEQAAYLFSRLGLYLDASNLMQKVDKIKAKNFKKLYAEAIVREGNKLFNKRDFEMAAKQYELAAQWSSIELKDENLINHSFQLAINSWVSACKCKEAFRILERLPHHLVPEILTEISDKIVAAADFLADNNRLDAARDQLYYSINTYQKEGLFEQLSKFTNKLLEILIKIFEKYLQEDDIYAAKNTYDEIENLWETFDVDKVNLDHLLEKLIIKLIKQLNFGLSSLLINKLNSLELKQKLTELSSETEEKEKELKKKQIEDKIKQGVDVLNSFIQEEREIIISINKDILNKAEILVNEEKFLDAADLIKKQADFLKSIGKTEISNQILIKSLDILLKGKLFDIFFKYYRELSRDTQRDYLEQIFHIYKEKLKEIIESGDYTIGESIFEVSNRLFRSQMLYEESKEISKLFIDLIKKEALRIVNQEESLESIKRAENLIKKVNDIASSYLEGEKFTFDKIYKRISEIFIKLDDLSSALAYSDKIENPEYKREINKRISKIESEKASEKTKRVKESLEGELLKERLSIIKKKARDAAQDKENELKQRKGLKRGYFNEALNLIKSGQLDLAVEKYKEAVLRLNRIKKYNLAGVSLAIVCILLLKQNKLESIIKLIDSLKQELKDSSKLLLETFPAVLVDYIKEIKKIGDEAKFREVLSYFEYLPLFEEEISILYDLLGKKADEEIIESKKESDITDTVKIIREINQLTENITKEKQDIAKRKMMKRQYWNTSLEYLKTGDYLNASFSYLDNVNLLAEKGFLKHSAIGLILGCLILIKEKGIHIAKATFLDYIKKLKRKQIDILKLPEIQIFEKLLDAVEDKDNKIIINIIQNFIEKLILFEEEIKYLKEFFGLEEAKTESIKQLSREEKAELSKIIIKLDQMFGILQQKFRDIRAESHNIFIKRKAMRRRYYNEILKKLSSGDLKISADDYLTLADSTVKRKDFQTSALMLLIYGLCALKAGIQAEQVKKNINSFLNSLGLNKSVVSDAFYTLLIQFLLEVKINNFNDYIPKIELMLKDMPLFEEEKVLIQLS